MVQVSLDAGETPIAAHLLPLSVDGLVIVASICLVEITNRLNHSTPPTTRPSALSTAQRTAQTTTPTAVTARPPAAAEPDRAGAASGGAGGSVVGDRVRQLAAEHPGWTQVELAEAAGCSVRTVRRHLTTPRPGTTELHEAPAVTPPSSAIDQLASTGATHNGSTP